MRLAALVGLSLAVLSGSALAKGESEYQKPAHMNADEVAILFLSGRYISPITCKLADGSQIDVEDSIVVKGAPEQGGGKLLKATFFEPSPGRWANNDPTSPCVVVSLPPRNYKDIRVIDQTGRVRASREG